ncbi:hypothetical protein PEKONANI_03326 [Aeromonas jandaei]
MLTRQLGFAVNVERGGCIGFPPGALTAAIKHIVGGVMHQPGTQCFRFFGYRCHAGRVEQLGKLPLALRFVDCGMGCGVDNHIRLDQTYRVGHPGRVAEITAIVGGVKVNGSDAPERRQCALQLPADLTILAKQQNMHQVRSPSFFSIAE